MKRYSLLLPIFFLVVSASVLQTDVIHVPSQQLTIQAGINAATTGDTVLVADGTYTGNGNHDIDFLGKAIVVMSENGAENCVIDCAASYEDEHRGFHFNGGEDSTTILEGFTIKNGYIVCDWAAPAMGGGILCYSSSPRITHNTIIENIVNGEYTGTGSGAGICCVLASPIIEENVIADNRVLENGRGGGILCGMSSYPLMRWDRLYGFSTSDRG